MVKAEKMIKIGQINNVSIYFSSEFDTDKVLVGHKGEIPVKPEIIEIPTKTYMESMIKCDGIPIGETEIKEILEECDENWEENRLSKINFIVGGSMNIEVYEKFLSKVVL